MTVRIKRDEAPQLLMPSTPVSDLWIQRMGDNTVVLSYAATETEQVTQWNSFRVATPEDLIEMGEALMAAGRCWRHNPPFGP